VKNDRVLVGVETSDDAGVYLLHGDQVLIQTVDFFTPIVDDPFDYGQIAAANSLSDVYAMGGTPITALNIVCYPMKDAPSEWLYEILRGGAEIWSKPVKTGEAVMCHSLENIEHHHFKFDAHRQPGTIHIHFYGAHSLSFGDGIELAQSDWVTVSFEGLGRPLRNPIVRESSANLSPIHVTALS